MDSNTDEINAEEINTEEINTEETEEWRTTMLILAVTIPIKPEGHDEAIEIAVPMTAETRKEEGCLAYTFHFPVDDPNTLFVYEEWASEEALNAHIASAHMKVFQERMPAVVAGGAQVKKYIVP